MNNGFRLLIVGMLLFAGVAWAGERPPPPPPPGTAWTALLQQHVVIVDGGHASRVDYAGMRRDQAHLDDYTRQLSAVSLPQFQAWDRNDQMAFLINAYNAFTIQLVLTRWPRLTSIKDLGGIFSSPWKQDFFVLLGQRTNLDHIESLLRTGHSYADPRIHFALNCASISCPMLRNEAYVGDRLDNQLADATKRFLGDRSRNRYDASGSTLEVSKIFDWYSDDFQRDAVGSVRKFLISQAASLGDGSITQQQLGKPAVSIRFLPYDWRLNSVPSTPNR
jgi:hypothetical protein